MRTSVVGMKVDDAIKLRRGTVAIPQLIPRSTVTPATAKCVHLGSDTGEQVLCAEGCKGTRLKVFECGVFGACTILKRGDGVGACCKGCTKFEVENAGHKALREAASKMQETAQLPQAPTNDRPLEWAYGVTTVEERAFNGMLNRTLASLRKAGFDEPTLFVDGDLGSHALTTEYTVVNRDIKIRTFGNWVLGMWELYLRQPQADRYAMFQDDMVTYPNLREYLDKTQYPSDGYLNLYTMPSNQSIAPAGSSGWYRALFLQCPKCHKLQRDTDVQKTGTCCGEKQFQYGRGAVALIFNREALQTLLSSLHMVQRPTDPGRGHRAIDGGISWAMNKAGWYEYVHNPSLVQHIGDVSVMGNQKHPSAPSFKGETFDARKLLAINS